MADSSGDAEVVSYTARLSIAASLFAAPPQAHSHQLHLRSAYAEYNRRTLPAPSPSASPSASASHYEPAYTNLTDKVSAATHCSPAIDHLPLPPSTSPHAASLPLPVP